MERPSLHPRVLEAIELSLVPELGLRARLQFWKDGRMEALPVRARQDLVRHTHRSAAAKLLDQLLATNCHVLVHGLHGYPKLLVEIPDPPLVLYGRGRLEALERPAVAVVGTRRPSYYGLEMAEGLASDLAVRGLAVTSGLARGIDAAAHRGALRAKGETIAVLGSGLDRIYPKEHRRLADEISEAGLILSELPPETPPLPCNFPVRNRIISGVSLGTIVVEAREASGSLITARLALEQNREVFALPGNVTSPQSVGPNFLIRQGAKLVLGWRDVVEELPESVRVAAAARVPEELAGGKSLPAVDPETERVLAWLDSERPRRFDDLLETTGLSVTDLSNCLLQLEIRGYVRQLPGALYLKTPGRMK